LAAGMDEYIAKPVQLHQLFNKLEEFSLRQGRTGLLATNNIRINETGDIQLLAAPLDTTASESAPVRHQINTAIQQLIVAAENHDLTTTEEIAHQIKELSNQISAEDLKNESFKIELAIRRGNMQKAREHIVKLSGLVDRSFVQPNIS